MPTSFQFLVFSDLTGMHDTKVKSKIRKHAMKDIGVTRRRPDRKPNKVTLNIRDPLPSSDTSLTRHHQPITDNRALYNRHIRALSSKLDPFSSASVPLDSVSHGLLQYFHHYSTKFPNNFTFTPNIDRVIGSAIQDALMMNCILSAAASRVRYVQAVSLGHLQQRALSCTHQSLRLLQQMLDSGHRPVGAQATAVLVDCILYLAAAALYRGDEPAARIHLKAAVDLTRQLDGGIHAFDDQRVVIRLLSLDDVLACMRLEPCSLACNYDPGPLSSLVKREMTATPTLSDKAASGEQLLRSALVPKGLRSLIPRIIECDLVKDAVEPTTSVSSPSTLQITYWQRLSALAIRNKLLAFTPSDTKENAIKAALIIWTLLPRNDPRQARTASIVAGRLKIMLQSDHPSAWIGSEEVGLWCLLVGAFAGLICGQCDAWFVRTIRGTLWVTGQLHEAQLQISNSAIASSLIELQRRVLFRESVLRPLTESLVELVISDEGCEDTH